MKITYARDACNAKVNHLQLLFDRYRGACTRNAKHLADESLRLQANLAATHMLAQSEFKRFRRVVLISVQDFFGQQVSQLETSVTEYNSETIDLLGTLTAN